MPSIYFRYAKYILTLYPITSIFILKRPYYLINYFYYPLKHRLYILYCKLYYSISISIYLIYARYILNIYTRHILGIYASNILYILTKKLFNYYYILL